MMSVLMAFFPESQNLGKNRTVLVDLKLPSVVTCRSAKAKTSFCLKTSPQVIILERKKQNISLKCLMSAFYFT